MIDCPFAHAELESKIGSRRKLVRAQCLQDGAASVCRCHVFPPSADYCPYSTG